MDLENGEGQTDVNELESNHMMLYLNGDALHCDSQFVSAWICPHPALRRDCEQGHPELDMSLSERDTHGNLARKQRTYSLISAAP